MEFAPTHLLHPLPSHPRRALALIPFAFGCESEERERERERKEERKREKKKERRDLVERATLDAPKRRDGDWPPTVNRAPAGL